MMKVCVYCGSNPGNSPIYREQTKLLAKALSDKKCDLVYGGGRLGLMGTIANEMLFYKRSVTGVMPSGLFRSELLHHGLTELVEVSTIPERKSEMMRLSDAFIAMPGGYGTFEEISEVLSYAQLGLHQKPIAFFNVNGFYDGFLKWINACIENGFIPSGQDQLFILESDPKQLVEKLFTYQPPKKVNKWQELDSQKNESGA
ncbi:TIGR00730 family Rossman fold protein [Listeria sp. PSOL-1]|uniref:LOG family protein n=1 Tax=Listeria sp. PSOL-1 TaxID=1844999 RepID=UPI0013D564A8|nr:TIGR00730 family Rossman fold protein [Listeria sp. PSOL-1]